MQRDRNGCNTFEYLGDDHWRDLVKRDGKYFAPFMCNKKGYKRMEEVNFRGIIDDDKTPAKSWYILDSRMEKLRKKKYEKKKIK